MAHASGDSHGHSNAHGQARGHHRHDHHHGHHHHGHAHARSIDQRRLLIAALLTGGFMLAEVVGGLLAGSLTLLADAGHMLTDFAGLSLAWYSLRLTRLPAEGLRTYGHDRLPVLAAFVNGLALFLIAGWIILEAGQRLGAPVEVAGGLMLWVAAAGLVVNLVVFRVLQSSAEASLNVRAATLHVLGDLLGSVAAMVAALVILLTGWQPIDPLLSVVVALIVLRSAFAIVRDSSHILLERAPASIDPRELTADLARSVPGVEEIHHVHAWSIDESRPMVTLHARVATDADAAAVVGSIKRRLGERFGVAHATVEIERGPCSDPDGCC